MPATLPLPPPSCCRRHLRSRSTPAPPPRRRHCCAAATSATKLPPPLPPPCRRAARLRRTFAAAGLLPPPMPRCRHGGDGRWVAIPILPRITARPDAAPAEAEGRGSWADMVRCFQQSMRECIKYMIRGAGINTKQNYQEINNILFGRLEGSRNPKRGFWLW